MPDLAPQLIVIAGPNGAGKTTFAPSLLRDTFGLSDFVNADTISAGLSAFRPDTAALEAGRVMLKTIHDLAEKRGDFAFETTLATRSYVPWIKDLRGTGYEFHLLFLWLRTAELAIQRVAARVRAGGHAINEAIIRRRYERGLINFFERYKPLADTWVVYDNSAAKPLLIAAGNQREQTVSRAELWEELQESRT